MDLTVFIVVLFSLQVVCLIVGQRSSKDLRTQEDYFLAGKGVSFFPLMMTFLATQVGGGLILGCAEEAYRFGWAVLLYPLGASLGLLLLGLGIGRRLAQFQISTISQIFEVFYRSSFLKKVASALSILTLFMILIAQIVGSNKFMLSLGVDSKLWFIGFWAIVILYTALGGLKAVVATDVIQATFFILVFMLCFGYVVFYSENSLPEVLEMGLNRENFAFDSSRLYGWLLMPLLFMVIEQDMGQRCFAARSPNTISKATLWAAGCTFFVSLIPVSFGILAKGSGIEIPAGTSVLITAIKHATNPIITALIGCAVLAAIISTADSLINAIGSHLAQDFGTAISRGKNIKRSQILSAAIAIVAIFFSFFFHNIIDLLIYSYELSVACLFVPIAIALFKKEGHPLSAALAIAFGGVGFILFKLIPTQYPKELLSLSFSLVGYGIGEGVVWKNIFSINNNYFSFNRDK